MAQTLATHLYYTSAGWSSVTAWATGTAKTVGNLVRQNTTPTVGNERVFVCTVAGTTHATTEPTWPTVIGASVVDNTVTWQDCTGLPAVNGDKTNTPISSQNRSSGITKGHIICDNSRTNIFICTTAGSSGASDPSFNTGSLGATTTDSTVTWTYIGTSFSSWAAPVARMNLVSSLVVGPFIGYVRSNHAETSAAAISIDFGANNGAGEDIGFVCVTGSNVPPVAADITTGASVATTGGVTNVSIGRNASYNGITFKVVGGSILTTTTTSASVRYDNCIFDCGATSGGLILGTVGGRVRCYGCTVKLGTAGAIRVIGGDVLFRDSATPLAKNGASFQAAPITSTNASDAGTCLFENCDFSVYDTSNQSLVSANNVGGVKMVFSHCKSPTNGSRFVSAAVLTGVANVDVVNCDDGTGTHTWYFENYRQEGITTTTSTAYRSAGASDGTTNFCWQVSFYLNSANNFASWLKPWESTPIDIWIDNTGSSRTVTFEGVWFGTAIPNNDQVWLDVVYFGSSSTTLGTRTTTTKTSNMASGSALTASTSAWVAPARQNSISYANGDLVTTSSNPGRIFANAVGPATSASSEPGGYATAVDGDTIVDNGCTFHAGWRFTIAATFTPQQKGYVRCYLKHALRAASSINPYSGYLLLDPKPVVT